MTLVSQAASGVRWTGIGSIATNVGEMARLTILAHYLSPVDFGLMAMVYVVIGIIQTYVDLGISAAIIHRQDVTTKQLSSLYWLNVFSGVVAYVFLWVSAPGISVIFREPRLTALLRLVAVGFIFSAVSNQFEVLLQKDLSFRVLAIQEITVAASSFVIGVILAVAGYGVWSLVWAFLGSYAIKATLLLRSGLVLHRPLFHFSRSDLQGFLGFGLFQLGERAINYVSERLDQIVIGPILGAQALGLYSFAFNLSARPISRINPIVTRVAFPVFAKVQEDTPRLRKGYLRIIDFLTTINAPVLIGLAVISPRAIPLIFGAKWTPSVALLQILCLMSLLRSIGNPIGSLQLAKGRADLGFHWNVALLLLSLPAVYIGAKVGAATGVALALLLLQLGLAMPVYLFMVRPLIGCCGQEYSASIVKPIVLAGAMAILMFALTRLHINSPNTIVLPIQILIGGLSYVALLMLFHRQVIGELRSLMFSYT